MADLVFRSNRIRGTSPPETADAVVASGGRHSALDRINIRLYSAIGRRKSMLFKDGMAYEARKALKPVNQTRQEFAPGAWAAGPPIGTIRSGWEHVPNQK